MGYNINTGIASISTINGAGVVTNVNGNTLTLGTGISRVIVDFNPTANAVRVTTSATTGNNRRVPTGGTGTLATDTDLNLRTSVSARALIPVTMQAVAPAALQPCT